MSLRKTDIAEPAITVHCHKNEQVVLILWDMARHGAGWGVLHAEEASRNSSLFRSCNETFVLQAKRMEAPLPEIELPVDGHEFLVTSDITSQGTLCVTAIRRRGSNYVIRGANWESVSGEQLTWDSILNQKDERACFEVAVPVLAFTDVYSSAIRCQDRLREAANPDTDVERLHALAMDPHGDVRRALANNPNLSVETLDHLANDPSDAVRRVVAGSDNISSEIETKLSRDPSEIVRMFLAGNRSLNAETLADLAHDPSEAVRDNVADHRKISFEDAKKLLRDPSENVRRAASRNPNAPRRRFSSHPIRKREEHIRTATIEKPAVDVWFNSDGDISLVLWDCVRHGIGWADRHLWESVAYLEDEPDVLPDELEAFIIEHAESNSQAHTYNHQPIADSRGVPAEIVLPTDGGETIAAHNIWAGGDAAHIMIIRRRGSNYVIRGGLDLGGNMGLGSETWNEIIGEGYNLFEVTVPVEEFANAFTRAHQLCRRARDRIFAAADTETNNARLIELSVDKEPFVRKTLAYHPVIDEETQKRLAKDDEVSVRRILAGNPAITETVQSALLRDSDEMVRLALAENPGVEPRILSELMNDANSHVRAAAIRWHPDKEVLQEFLKDADPNVRVALAQRGIPSILTSLARDDDKEVCSAVASNSRTPIEVLRQLACVECPTVRARVAANVNTPTDVLGQLLSDETESVQSALAGNRNMSPGGLERLASSNCVNARLSVTKNPNASAETLNRLAFDNDPDVRTAVAPCPDLSSEALMHLANAAEVLTRIAVAENPKLPLEAIKSLARDTHIGVRSKARTRVIGLITTAFRGFGGAILAGATSTGGDYPKPDKQAFWQLLRQWLTGKRPVRINRNSNRVSVGEIGRLPTDMHETLCHWGQPWFPPIDKAIATIHCICRPTTYLFLESKLTDPQIVAIQSFLTVCLHIREEWFDKFLKDSDECMTIAASAIGKSKEGFMAIFDLPDISLAIQMWEGNRDALGQWNDGG